MLISHDIGDGRPVTVNGPYHKGFSFLLGLNRNLFKFTMYILRVVPAYYVLFGSGLVTQNYYYLISSTKSQ